MLDYGCPSLLDLPDHGKGGGVGDDDGASAPARGRGDGSSEAGVHARDVYVGEGSIGVEGLGAVKYEAADAAGFE